MSPQPSMDTRGMAILIWSADLTHAARLATPLLMAQAAAALEVEVEVFFAAQSVQLLTREAGTQTIGFGAEAQTLDASLQAAAAAGVRLWACSQALHAAGWRANDLVPVCSGQAGAVAFMARALDPTWRALVF